jgi:hypothetical protein
VGEPQPGGPLVVEVGERALLEPIVLGRGDGLEPALALMSRTAKQVRYSIAWPPFLICVIL